MKHNVSWILSKIENLNKELRVIQLNCEHENVDMVARSNTGNYDPSNDSYWYDCRCLDCDRFWMEDQ